MLSDGERSEKHSRYRKHRFDKEVVAYFRWRWLAKMDSGFSHRTTLERVKCKEARRNNLQVHKCILCDLNSLLLTKKDMRIAALGIFYVHEPIEEWLAMSKGVLRLQTYEILSLKRRPRWKGLYNI